MITIAPTAGLLAVTARSYEEHVLRVGPLPDLSSLQIERLVLDSGLTGRGGAGFPTGRKLAAVAGGSRDPVVVANAAEGEPASSKDRALLLHAPPRSRAARAAPLTPRPRNRGPSGPTVPRQLPGP